MLCVFLHILRVTHTQTELSKNIYFRRLKFNSVVFVFNMQMFASDSQFDNKTKKASYFYVNRYTVLLSESLSKYVSLN